ncbi:carbon-monoxide dehydrogenase small subunit [Methylobacterium sp. PvP062]|uniref:Carbon-monoxide dehydrogenase small subunit n=1 Tax=Methylobacterium radiotolerans TaxID=31998 RepID=A0ABV2NTS3_9HYPH|nr:MULTISPECIES: 2Fe-2S iron-sulfur cluster-binding protein [unclassified Methylobacterium]MBP2498290.1 carbon-monoxide dehydrogenase small subunit [Methylobacterium sp. PvP105]MBP2505674.1 carbon-monoxide dehydrogenase small subunit [Methylobacterium sp. PvP109]
MLDIALTVNGERRTGRVEPRTSIGEFLRESLNLTGTHLSCQHGVCGACTLLVDGKPMRSCIMSAAQANGREIITIEGFDDDPVMSDLRRAFSREHGLQCGYCTPGMLVTARDIVLRLGDPGEERTRAELAGNLCRCTGYVGIVRAIRSVGATRPAETQPQPPRLAPVATVVPSTSPKAGLEALGSAPTRLGPTPNRQDESGQVRSKTSGGTDGPSITQTAVVHAGIDDTWALFRDLNRVAGCVPGAELTSFDDTTFEGLVAVALGPIRAKVSGRGTYAFDNAAHSGAITGSGQDKITRSKVRGDLSFKLKPLSPSSTELTVTLAFDIQGPLAQFSRSSIVREFTMRLMEEFATRASASITGGEASTSATRPLGAFAAARMMLAALWNSIFRRQ